MLSANAQLAIGFFAMYAAVTQAVDAWARSTDESAVKEGGEEMLGLAQGLALHLTQALHLLNQGRELLLEGDVFGSLWASPFVSARYTQNMKSSKFR